MSSFFDEVEVYYLLKAAGLKVPRFGVLHAAADLPTLPFKPGDPVVLKGVVEGLWHKSDLGLVRFTSYFPGSLLQIANAMREASRDQGSWSGMLVTERIPFHQAEGLPSEAIVALRHHPDTGWTVLLGLGGIHAEDWAKVIPPLFWPVAFVDPATALKELVNHPLGRIWLGRLRQCEALSTEDVLATYLQNLWQLAARAEAEGLELLEMNPVVIGKGGIPTALDGVGTLRAGRAEPRPFPRPTTLYRCLVTPRRIAVAGISSHRNSPGRVILENLLASRPGLERLVPIKPGETEILGLPCLQSVEALKTDPVDLLVVALPAPKTVKLIEQLCEQGGGAEVLYLVPGGLGDGADTQGRGAHLEQYLEDRRSKGLWAPSLVGPNGVGFICAEGGLDALFIPLEKLPIRPRGGSLALLSQSGAFLLTCLSNLSNLGLRYAASIGNQVDLRLSDFLRTLGGDPHVKIIACYVEGFRTGDLMEVAAAARDLAAQDCHVLLYKGGRNAEGQAAASSHTGALAGDWELQRALLRRSGIKVARSFADFEAALGWLSIYPRGRSASVAILTNAGFEAVASADGLGRLEAFRMDEVLQARLQACLGDHGLQDLVAPRLPLDLTPMAGERAYLDCARLLLEGGVRTLVLGLVPFTQYLETEDPAAMRAFALALKTLAVNFEARLGAVVDAGEPFEPYRTALADAGLPVFRSMESALAGLKLAAL